MPSPFPGMDPYLERPTLFRGLRTAALVQAACGKFPSDMPPEDWFVRQDERLDVVSPDSDAFEEADTDFYKYADDLSGLLESFALRG